MTWVNLHTHTEFSLLDGFGSPGAFARRAAELGQPALAITDHGNLHGAVQFAAACQKAGIKPILGCELYVADGPRTEPPGPGRADYFHLTVLAQNRQGWQNLMALVADASTNGMYRKPRTDRKMLAAHREGLIVLSGCLGGEVNQLLLAGECRKAAAVAAWYRDVFGPNHYYLEWMDHGQRDDAIAMARLLDLASRSALTMVPTADCHYPTPEDAQAADVLHCIATGKQLSDEKRFRLSPFGRYYLPSEEELRQHFDEAALAAAGHIASMVEPDVLGFGGHVAFPELPWIVKPGDGNADGALARLVAEGIRRRFPSDSGSSEVTRRAAYELTVIERMGFAPYFLIVADYTRWARERGIVCGPRGSAAGSLVLYLLGVSDIDPIAWNLPFERFLNPDRVSMPDVDMDFADHRRGEVLEYLIQRYGADRVGGIVAISTLGARAAIKDVGKALGYDLAVTTAYANLVPKHPVDISLDQARSRVVELETIAQQEAQLFAFAQHLEGTVRHASTHAAGVVVSADPLVSVVPTQRPTGGGTLPVSQWDMHDVEDAGLIKFDFLGLANLSMIERCLALLGRDVDWLLAAPQDDPRTWEALRAGHTKTTFQLEGRGMSSWLVQLKPTEVEHLAAMVALYRPGPMDQIKHYVERRRGREEISYPHESLENVLAATYGIPVYQEQVMAVAREYAGFTPGEADTLRKVMGKKLKDEVSAQRAKFLDSAETHGRDRDEAQTIWEYVEPFAGYGFNRSHAVAYAIVAYQTAYLKANHPLEWMAAVLSTVAGKPDQLASAIDEARRLRVPILAPCINASSADFEPEGDGIRYSLGAVKGVGEAAVETITYERYCGGPFESFFDFCRRVDLKVCNRRVIEALAKAGAFDAFMARSSLLAVLDAALYLGKSDAPEWSLELPCVAPVERSDRLAWEREALGVYVTDHPFRQFNRTIDAPGSMKLGELEASDEGKHVVVVGYIAASRRVITKRGDPMAILTLDDLTGSTEVVVFPRTYEATASTWAASNIVRIEGRVDIREGQLQIIADSGQRWRPEVEEVREARPRYRLICPPVEPDEVSGLARLVSLLARH